MAGYGRGILRGATGGMSQLAASLMRGPQVEQQAYDAEMGSQTRLAQALAQIGMANAKTDQTNAETAVLQGRPGLVEEQAALSAGVDIPTIRAFRERLAGGAPVVPMGPEAPDGSMGAGSAQFGAETTGNIARALQRLMPLSANTGDIKVDDWAQALGRFREQDLGDAVLNGTRTAGDVGRAQAAVAAKPLYNADSTGAVLDLFGGGLATDNPMAGATIGLRKEQAGQAKAGAAENYAQAENARASAAKTRAEAAEGAGAGGKAPQGYRWKADGGLEPIPGGPADPAVKGSNTRTGPMSATLQKELIEADDTVQAAAGVVRALEAALKQNDAAYSGYFAKERARLRSNLPGDSEAADATINIDNLMTGQGLESLKSIFGAAPTEGERKILMDMQASVDKTPAQRRAIMERAIEAAKRRAIYSNNKAQAIRSGSYLTEGIVAPPAGGQPASAAGPKPGDVDGGYRFKGGNPSDPKNWEKV